MTPTAAAITPTIAATPKGFMTPAARQQPANQFGDAEDGGVQTGRAQTETRDGVAGAD